MATVHQDRIARNTDATEWPGWTDDETIGLSDPNEWPAWTDELTPSLPPDGPDLDRAADLRLVEWIRCQVVEHQSRSQEDDDLHELVATALNDLWCVASDRKCQSIAELLSAEGAPYRRIRLDRVAIPAEPRRSRVADLLDEEARYYLDLGSDLGRVAAWAILQHAESAEYYGSESLQEYYDDEAAWLAAVEATEVECEMPLW